MGVHQLRFTIIIIIAHGNYSVVVTIGFDATAYDVLEGARVVNVSVVLMGRSDRPLSVVLNTRDGAAMCKSKGVNDPCYAARINFDWSNNTSCEHISFLEHLETV
jgi:hypothetical protein